MLKTITAEFACDGCGELFSVSMDPACGPYGDWSTFDFAVDAVRGSIGYRGPTEPGHSSSVQRDKHLCGNCTHKADHPKESDSEDGPVIIRILCSDCGCQEAEVTEWEDGEAIEGECQKCGALVNLTDE